MSRYIFNVKIILCQQGQSQVQNKRSKATPSTCLFMQANRRN